MKILKAGPYIASGGDINTLFLALLLFGIGFGIYTPFILAANKQAYQYSPELLVERFSRRSKRLAELEDVKKHFASINNDDKKILQKEKE